jgi:hypothetical protein
MSTVRAQQESGNLMAIARAETRNRKKWLRIDLDQLDAYGKRQVEEGVFAADVMPTREVLVRRLFGVRADAPVRVSEPLNLIAVWRGDDKNADGSFKEPTEEQEPDFLRDPPSPKAIEFETVPREKLSLWKRLFGGKQEDAALGANQGAPRLERGGGGFGGDEEA